MFVHVEHCDGPQSPGYPEDFRPMPLVFRAYDRNGRIVGGQIVEPGRGVAFLHARCTIYGCYMFAMTAKRA